MTDELAAKRKSRAKPGTKTGRKPGTSQGPTTSARQLATQAKDAQAVQLRLMGASLAAIAAHRMPNGEQMYAGPAGAHQAITRALKAMIPEEDRAELRRVEIAKLDRLEQNAWPRALSGDEKAEATILRCIAQRSKLRGLEAPVELDVRVGEGDLVRIEILDVLNDAALAALEPFQDEMSRLSELRAGAIEGTATVES